MSEGGKKGKNLMNELEGESCFKARSGNFPAMIQHESGEEKQKEKRFSLLLTEIFPRFDLLINYSGHN
jgi:hypothetical protein